MRYLKRVAAVIATVSLFGCAQAPIPAWSALPALQVAPSAFQTPLWLAQRLTVEEMPESSETGVQQRQLDALLQVEAGQLQLVALALGQRVLSIQWDGRSLAVKRHPMLPATVDASRVLRDIGLVFASIEALRAALPVGWTLDDGPFERRLRQGDAVALTVRYLDARRSVEIDNQAERYRLRIDSRLGEGS